LFFFGLWPEVQQLASSRPVQFDVRAGREFPVARAQSVCILLEHLLTAQLKSQGCGYFRDNILVHSHKKKKKKKKKKKSEKGYKK